VDYLRDIQSRGTDIFVRDKPNWLVFCAQAAMEWRMYTKEAYGSITNIQKTICISPGLTVAFPAGAFDRVNPGYREHTVVGETINKLKMRESCGYNETSKSKCLVILNAESSNGSFPVIRARTPTSTGMGKVLVSNHEMSKEAKKTMDRLTVLQVDYNISRDGLQWLNKYMEEHVVDISTENLKGQCTKGHSCKVRWLLEQCVKGLTGLGNGTVLNHTFSRFFFSCSQKLKRVSKVSSIRAQVQN
jgi:hypothetical protein